MADTNDTIDGLLAEFRGYSAGMPPSYHVTMSWADFRRMLDRFDAAHKRELAVYVLAIAKLRGALVKCRDIALLWQVDEAAGVAGTTDKPHARSAAEAVIDIEFEINAALFATATAEKLSAVGDAAKLREALDESRRIASDLGGCRLNDYWKLNEIVRVCESALAAPPRNCDVGTAQEQDERFHRFCVKHHTGSCAGCHNPVGDYTVANGVRECALVWAQMPYEEGGAK